MVRRGDATNISQIQAVIEALTGTDTGGVPITSYQIDFDMNTNSENWFTLKGFNSNDLSLSVFKTGLTVNTPYKFRYRAKNIFGWGEFSEESTLLPNQIPGKPDPLFTQIVSSNVLL